MKDKINIAELLKDCPKGMELDCYMFNGLEFDHINTDNENCPIVCRAKTLSGEYNMHTFTKYGWYTHSYDYSKCVIFPKGKTTWEGFQIPFKDGDIIFTHANCLKVGLENTWISIFQEKRNGGVATYVDYAEDGDGFYSYNEDKGLLCMEEDIMRQRLASEEEKAKLFQAIKKHGYKWNPETKTLEKLVEPKFKVGDRIRHKTHIRQGNVVTEIKDTHYILDDELALPFISQDDYELVPDKFDITTLKTFDKVLVRDKDTQEWVISLFSHCNGLEIYKYFCINGAGYSQCIPYECNQHLLGKTDNCVEYFKTWE